MCHMYKRGKVIANLSACCGKVMGEKKKEVESSTKIFEKPTCITTFCSIKRKNSIILFFFFLFFCKGTSSIGNRN